MMYIRGAREHFTTWRGRVPVCWLTVAVFAIVIAYSDGFWVTSLEGTVGAIERSGTPLHRWLLDSTLMLPLFFLAVVIAVLMARRLVGGSRSALVKFATTALLVAVLGTVVAVAEMGASAAYDYHLQTRHLQVEQQLHHTHPAAQAGVVTPTPTGSCIGLCASVRDTFNVHMRSLSTRKRRAADHQSRACRLGRGAAQRSAVAPTRS